MSVGQRRVGWLAVSFLAGGLCWTLDSPVFRLLMLAVTLVALGNILATGRHEAGRR